MGKSSILTMALIPPDETKSAVAWPDCWTAPSKLDGKQLKHKLMKNFTSFNLDAARDIREKWISLKAAWNY